MRDSEIKIGARIELHPCLDLWMRGARYGKVIAYSYGTVWVELDQTGKVHRVSADNILREV